MLTAIRDARVAQNRSYAWLARATQVPYKRLLAEVKHGHREATLETVLACANALNIDLVALFTDAQKLPVAA